MYATQLAPYFRSPSRMAISWSYDRSEFWLLWESDYPPFFILLKKTQLSVLRIYFLGSLYCSVILLPVILLLVIFPVIWCFPIWLTTSLRYPMAIFSANSFGLFLLTFHKNIRHHSPTFSFMARDHWPHLESPIFTIIKKDPHLSIILRRRSFINHVDTVFGGYFLSTIFCNLGIYKLSLILLSLV